MSFDGVSVWLSKDMAGHVPTTAPALSKHSGPLPHFFNMQRGIAQQCLFIRINRMYKQSSIEDKEIRHSCSLVKSGEWHESKLLFGHCQENSERLFVVFTRDGGEREISHIAEIENISFSGSRTNFWFSYFSPISPIKNSRTTLIVTSTKNQLPLHYKGDHAICETPEWLIELVNTST